MYICITSQFSNSFDLFVDINIRFDLLVDNEPHILSLVDKYHEKNNCFDRFFMKGFYF